MKAHRLTAGAAIAAGALPPPAPAGRVDDQTIGDRGNARGSAETGSAQLARPDGRPSTLTTTKR